MYKPPALCMTAEEEAAMLTKMMHEQGGQMDPEEMQAYLRKARGQKNRKPPQFMRLTGPLKMMTMYMPNDGFKFEVGVPFSQKFQTQLSWAFSNSKPAELEVMAMLVGGSSMMMEDEMSLIQAVTSGARKQVVVQKPLPYGIKAGIEMELGSPDPNQCMMGFSLHKDMGNSHMFYQY